MLFLFGFGVFELKQCISYLKYYRLLVYREKLKIFLFTMQCFSVYTQNLYTQGELLRQEAERQRDIAMGKVGADGKEIVRPETPMVNGYKLMSMAPSPSLGVTDSPLMTWGEVETTPYRHGWLNDGNTCPYQDLKKIGT